MMPAGRYYIGDLCYVMHPEWDEFCGITLDGMDSNDGEFTLADGRRFASYGTSHGDGCYLCSNGAMLGVDAGLIGCIRVDDIREPEGLKQMEDLGTVVEFAEPFQTWEAAGTIFFGKIYVETDPDSDDELDDDEDQMTDDA